MRKPAEQATVKCQNMDTFSSIPAHVISSEVRIVYVSIKGKSLGKVKIQHLNNDNIRGSGTTL